MKKEMKYPFKRVGIASIPSLDELRNIHIREFSSKAGGSKKEATSEYLEYEKADSVSDDWKKDLKTPDWVHKLFDKTSSLEEIFMKALKLLRKIRTPESFRIAQLILNEIGRTKEGSEFLKSRITQEIVDEFTFKED